jgi:hypothetical protein
LGEKGNIETVAAHAPASNPAGIGLTSAIRPDAAAPATSGIGTIANQAAAATPGGGEGNGAGDSVIGSAIDQVSDTVGNAGSEILGGFVGGSRKSDNKDEDE